MTITSTTEKSVQFLKRYRGGESRTKIFRDLVLEDILLRPAPVVLDIGCGNGFDGDAAASTSLCAQSANYIGVEPDKSVTPPSIFFRLYQTTLEEAPVEAASVDVAFSVMVMEHIERPQPFIDKLFTVLKPGGVFWGFTIDSRHWFPIASKVAESLSIKDLYLNLIHGRRGDKRYHNYPVYYRMNRPEAFAGLASKFQSRLFLSFYRPGDTDFYYPRPLRRMAYLIDSVSHAVGFPGPVLAVRLEK